MIEALLLGQNLSYQFGDRLLFSELNLEVKPGEFWAVIGDSGAGKSTLLKVLSRELQSPTGQLRVQSSCAEVPQGLALCPGLTALETIATGELTQYSWLKTLWGIPSASLESSRILGEALGLGRVLHQDIDELSGGERQRVALGRALLQKSRCLILDEPVSMLNHDLGLKVIQAAQQESAKKNGAIVCSLHQLHLVRQFATHVLEISSKHSKGWKMLSPEVFV